MNVLYDISVLGLGHSNPKARTGIFRVIENVAEELIKEDLHLTLCAIQNEECFVNALKYLAENENLSKADFAKPSFIAGINRKIGAEISDIITTITNPQTAKFKALSYKILYRLLLLSKNITQTKTGNLIDPKYLNDADIYHSPFYPIEQEVKNKGKKALFLTCYDLIPVLMPQYVDQGIESLIRNVLDSMDKETWIPCISESTRQDLLNFKGNKVDPEKAFVVELAASNLFYQSTNAAHNRKIRDKYNIPDEPYVLSLCTLEPRKNIDQTIRAFVTILKQENIPELNLVLVGTKGWKFDKIFDEIQASQDIKNRIIITGFVADEDLAALYSQALMFVYPSFYEGFGLPPLEAMQCGVPVITSNTSSLPEVVGDSGIMVSPKDLDQLCHAMLQLYKNRSLRENLSEKSLARAKMFSWKRCAQETVMAYKKAVSYK